MGKKSKNDTIAKPLFKSNKEALTVYESELNKIAKARKKSVVDLLTSLDYQSVLSEEDELFLSLYRRVTLLKHLNKPNP